MLVETLIIQGAGWWIDDPAGPLPPMIFWEKMRRRVADRGSRTTAEILADDLAESVKH